MVAKNKMFVLGIVKQKRFKHTIRTSVLILSAFYNPRDHWSQRTIKVEETTILFVI